MKRLIALLLALFLFVSVLPLAGAFTDDRLIKDTYKRAVTEMADAKIINGFEDGSFGPSETLTRAQAAKILCVMLEGSEKAEALTKTETGFADVPASHWAAKYVAYCVDKGIVAGVGDGRFDPNGELSSAAFAKMLLVAYGEDGKTFTGADWKKNVQAAAEKTFCLYQFDDGVTDFPMQREQAAQMAFNAKFQADAMADKAKGDPRTFTPSVPETMKLLVIGNSFGNDCSISYLWHLLQSAGVKDVTVGTLYYSGCPYSKHVDFALQDSPVYKYHKWTMATKKMVSKTKLTFDKIVGDEDWTHIMMLSGFAYLPTDFGPAPWQDLLLAYVRRTHPDAWYGYDMTWPFRGDYEETGKNASATWFKDYHNGDQLTMLSHAVDEVKKYVEPEQRFKFIAPVGTAIQNARTSFIGDHLDRDGYHLNKGIGRYVATMTVCCTLTGVDPDKITYLPEAIVQDKKDFTIPGLNMKAPGLKEALGKVARESVKNALAKPYEVTQSALTAAPK